MFCLPGYRSSRVEKVSALTAGILSAPVGGHLPIQGSQLGLVPWPCLCKRGKAAGSLDIKCIWVIQRGMEGGQPEQMRSGWCPFPRCWLVISGSLQRERKALPGAASLGPKDCSQGWWVLRVLSRESLEDATIRRQQEGDPGGR